ncbi:MAG: tetratricopeptide repeat protein [Myxococcales bacterium]|nr:MAG: tetratricopeptide repeat protein [Myxococcales bacterium]
MQKFRCTNCALIIASELLWLGTPAFADAQSDRVYDLAFAASISEEKRGNVSGAIQLLLPVKKLYPQDFELMLRLGWLYFQNEQYNNALENYQQAFSMSNGDDQAALGLGWSLSRLNRCPEALVFFDDVLRKNPDQVSAKEGQSFCDEPGWLILSLGLSSTYQYHSAHPYLDWGLGVSPRISAILDSVFLLDISYRRTEFQADQSSRAGASPNRTHGISVDEAFLSMGLQSSKLGALLTYAFAASNSDYLARAHALGLRGSVRYWGEFVLENSATFYSDLTVWRFAPSWAMPLTSWLSIQPYGALQVLNSELPVEAGLTSTVWNTLGSLWLGCRLGKAKRPTRLSEPSIYNTFDTFRQSVYSGASLRIAQHWQLWVNYQIERRQLLDELSQTHHSLAHYFSLGISLNNIELGE